MNWLADVGEISWNVLRGLLTTPYAYIGLLLTMVFVRRQIQWERKLFHTKLHSYVGGVLRMLIGGLAAGAIASMVMVGFGTVLTPQALIWLWAVALVLMLFRLRFLCFAYATGVLGVLQAAVSLVPQGWLASGGGEASNAQSWLSPIVDSLAAIHIPSLLALTAVLHLLEAALVRFQGEALAMPLFLEGKRGKIVGGYRLQGFWPVPLALFVPASVISDTGAAHGLSLPWTPLFGSADPWSGGWTLLAFPMIIGFTEMTKTKLPKHKLRSASALLLVYGGVLLVAAVGAQFVSWLILPAALIGIALHEALIWKSRFDESSAPPLYVHDGQAMMVLGTLPGSPAAELGIVTGDRLYRVHGKRVTNKAELHDAIRINPAFIKLEIMDQRGEIRFLQRALYAGDHHQLGILLAPDDDAPVFVESKERTMLGHITKRAFNRRQSEKATSQATSNPASQTTSETSSS